MFKRILFMALTVASLMAVPITTKAVPAIEIVENDIDAITISVTGESTLHVTGAAGQVLSIYNVTGMRVASFKVDSSDKSYNLSLPKGCYIVKVGKVVRKISIR
jgi:hypothetical protein